MKKSGKGAAAGQSRSIRTLSRKDPPPQHETAAVIGKRNHVAEHTYQNVASSNMVANSSGMFTGST